MSAPKTATSISNSPHAEFHFSGADYLNNWVLPNVYFHITTGYGILRHKGVPLGKPDFLAGEQVIPRVVKAGGSPVKGLKLPSLAAGG